ncbi:hypothetical protein PUN28_017634 [Cardiocondyla obscurior]|uniref:Uncharacterized protein n=1 Tax=Cardiocondyla obscurior TaxID=286306 RepID=A0AAW2EKP1_9HYME
MHLKGNKVRSRFFRSDNIVTHPVYPDARRRIREREKVENNARFMRLPGTLVFYSTNRQGC